MMLLCICAAFAQAPKLVWSTAPAGAAPGAVFTTQPIVEAHDASDTLDTAFSGPITVAIKAPTATGGAVLLGTTTMNAAFGQAVFTDLKINLPGSYILQATAAGLASADASINVVTTLAEVWSVKEATGVNASVAPDGFHQQRSFAVNMNPGSPYAGTMYVTRRLSTAAAAPELNCPADVFFWRGVATNASAATGSGMLKPSGPDMAHPDGKFDLTGLTLPANAFWGIGVGGDDYVYTAGLNGGQLLRFNPDGTGGVVVVAAGFAADWDVTKKAWANKFVRYITVTGKGADTAIWFVRGDTGTAVEKWTAAGPADNPTSAFKMTKLFSSTETAPSQRWRLVPNSTRDTLYYAYNTTAPGLSKYSITGVKDATFGAGWALGAFCADIDSQDRMLLMSFNTSQGFTALSPRNGANITNKGDGTLASAGGLTPAILTSNAWVANNNSNGLFVARYSDRHYVWFAADSSHYAGTPTGSYCGVISTDMPAPAPTGVNVINRGTGNSLSVVWTGAKDPEVIGYNVYVSTTPGALGVQSNSAPIAGTSYEAPGLTSGQTYYFTVRSVGSDPFTGASYEGANLDQYSDAPSLVSPPEAPGAITATDTMKSGEVVVSWTTPALYTEFIRIYRSTEAGTLGPVVKLVTAPTPGAPATWTDAGLTNGIPVFYTVKAVNGKDEESSNTAQVTATPTDQIAPVFAGITAAKDYGYPGARLTWAGAVDNASVTYKVYLASTYGGFNLSSPVGATTELYYDVRDLVVGQTYYALVKAVDSSGNTDSNNVIVELAPTRVIIDPDQNAPSNWDKVNVQPDSALPALVTYGVGSGKGETTDMFPTTYGANTYFYNTNDKHGKVQYSVPINAAGSYELDACWLNSATTKATHVRYSVTKPNGDVMPDVFLDELGGTGGNGSKWNPIVAATDLTPGTMTVLVDFTTVTETASANIFAAPAIRALIQQPIYIYKTATPPTPDGNITAAEWAGAQDIVLGKLSQSFGNANWTGPADYSAHVYLKWDSANLYVGEVVADDVVSLPVEGGATSFYNDSLELYLGLQAGADLARTAYITGYDFQVLLSGYGASTITGTSFSNQAYGGANALANAVVAMKRVTNNGVTTGYTLEAKIPWTDLLDPFFTQPVEDQIIGFNLHGNDNDQPTPTDDTTFGLTNTASAWQNPSAWTTATLKGLPPTAVKGDVNGDGAFSSADVLEAIKIAAGISSVNALQLPRADVAGAGADGRAADGKVDMQDVARLRRALNGKDTL
jgi:hypothetical protein